jgi:hypothetical protein
LAGAAVATVAAPETSAGADGERRHGIQFDRVLDAVEDLGLDPTGATPVNEQLASALEEGTLVRFPEGDYQFDGELSIVADRVGFLGEGNVWFAPPTGCRSLLFNYDDPPDEVLIEGVTVDVRAPETTTGIKLFCRNTFHIQNVEFIEGDTAEEGGQISPFVLGVANEGGRGVLRNGTANDGDVDGHAGDSVATVDNHLLNRIDDSASVVFGE